MKIERKIKSIEYTDGLTKKIKIVFNDKEWANFYSFGKDILSTVSDGVLKSTLVKFKEDILKSEWNIEQLKEWYIKNGNSRKIRQITVRVK